MLVNAAILNDSCLPALVIGANILAADFKPRFVGLRNFF